MTRPACFNLFVGIIGAFLGGFIFSSLLGFRYEEGFNVPSVVVATIGAVVLLTDSLAGSGLAGPDLKRAQRQHLFAAVRISIFAIRGEATMPGSFKITPGGTEESVARLEALGRLMDGAFVLPGTNIRLGLDAIIGLVPVAGDVISGLVSSYLIWEARQLGTPRWLIARMMANAFLIRP